MVILSLLKYIKVKLSNFRVIKNQYWLGFLSDIIKTGPLGTNDSRTI